LHPSERNLTAALIQAALDKKKGEAVPEEEPEGEEDFDEEEGEDEGGIFFSFSL